MSPTRLDLVVRAAGRAVVGRDWAWDGVRSRFLRLYAVHAGAAEVAAAGRRLRLAPGSVALVPAGGPLGFSCPGRMDHTWVHIHAGDGDGDAGARFSAGIRTDPALHAALVRVPALAAGGPADRLCADGLLRVVLAAFLDPAPRADDRLALTADWARGRLGEPLRLADLAAAAGLPARVLRGRWRERWGLSPTAWLRRERLAAARALLRQEEVTMAAVAARTGLGGRSQLSRWLRRTAAGGRGPAADPARAR